MPENVIITVSDSDCVLLCRGCSQRVGQPHEFTCPVYANRVNMLPTIQRTPIVKGDPLTYPMFAEMEAYRKVQAVLCGLYGPDHYYTKEYHKHELGYHMRIAEWLGRHSRTHNLGTVLDIGAAYGTLAAYCTVLGATQVHVVDKTPYIPVEIQDECMLDCLSGDIERDSNLIIEDRYDIIILTEVLEHFNFYPVPTMYKIMKGLKPGGVILLSTPDQATWGKITTYAKELCKLPEYEPSSQPDWIDAHIWQYSKEDLEWLFRVCGLEPIEWGMSKSAGGTHHNVVLRNKL